MTAWMHLLSKELKLGKKFMFSCLLFITFFMFVGLGFTIYYPYGILSALFLSSLFLLVFYVFAYLVVSFSNEKYSLSIWLQTPQSGWKLILAKLVAATLSMILTLSVGVAMVSVMIAIDGVPDLMKLVGEYSVELTEADLEDILVGEEVIGYIQEHYLDLVLVVTPLLVSGAILIGGFYLVFHFSRLTLQRRIGRWSILASVLITILSLWVYDRITESPIMKLFSWGSIPIKDTTLHINDVSVSIFLESTSLGSMLFNMIIVGLVVLACGWLLDKKVEV